MKWTSLKSIPNKSPSTLIRFQTNTEVGYRQHYNAENDYQKRSDLKTMLFENAVF